MRARSLAALTLLAAIPTFASIRGTAMSRDGQPISGAKVSIFALQSADESRVRLLSKTPARAPIASTTTDSKGAFVFESPKDAVVDLMVEANGYGPAGEHVERDDDAVVLALSAASAKQGSISANGKPVAGASVVWVGNAVETVATTDANGKYSVPDPAKWASRVLVIHPDYAIVDEVFSTLRKAETNFTLDNGVAISGKVVNGTTPVAKATVFVDRWPLATTGDDGTFAIVHASKTWDTLDATSGDLSATAMRSNAAVTLKLAPASGITGVLRDAKTQLPVAGAELSISHPMPGRGNRSLVASTLTDAKGAFTVNVRPGVYDIACSHPSYAARVSNVSVLPQKRLQKSIAANAKARVTGTVIDEQKRPIAAVKISMDPADSGMRGPGIRRAQILGAAAIEGISGPDGRFTVRTTMEGEVELSASKRGIPDGKSAVFKLNTGDRKTGVTITIPRGVALTGRVLDHDRKPVSGVAVVAAEGEQAGGNRPGGAMIRRVILNLAPQTEDPVLTGTDGSFSIAVKEGNYDLRFSREGFAPKTVRNEQVSASSKPLEVTLDPGVEITGRVVRGGQGIEGVNVMALESDSRSSAMTGPDGRFTVSDLTPGSYMVIANKADDFVDQRKSVTAPARDITIEVPPGGRITGHVIDKAGHQPVTSFQAGVNRSRSGGGFQIMMPPVTRNFTADDGSFVLENVPAGTVQLIVSAPGFTTSRVSNITVDEGKTTADVEVALETGVRLTGHVTGPDGAPLSGAQIRPSTGGDMRIPGMPGETQASTDANGEYSIEQLEAGDNKTFQFSRSGYLPEQRTVTLSGKETRLDVQLSSGMTVSGMVVTEGGAPVADAGVRAVSAAAGSIGRSTTTDASGGFVLDTIAPGRYTITASKNGFGEGVLRDFDVTGGGSPRIVIKSGGTLTGHVSGVPSADLTKVTVVANSSNGSAEATPDSTGAYRIEGAPTGTVRVSAMLMRGIGDNRSTDAKSIDLAAGATATVDLAFSSDTVIRGRITRNGVPSANTSVQFTPRGGSGVQTRSGGTTDDSGTYNVTGLSDGDYNVIVVDMQRLSPYSTTYSVHGSGTFDIDMRTSTLRGRVVDRGDNSPIGNARVQLQQKDPATQGRMAMLGATSDDSGAFTIDGVAAGSYTISAEKDGYGNNVKDLSLNDSGNPDVTLDLMRNDGVTLNVVDGRDGRQLNAFVNVYDAQNRQVYSSGGRFGGGSDSGRIPLAPGQYRASVSASGYATKTVSIMSPSTQTVSLTPGGTLIIRSSATATRRAILLDASGSPYGRPFSADPSFPITPGETRLQNVVAGQYTLQVLGANGAAAVTKTVVVVEGQESAVDL